MKRLNSKIAGVQLLAILFACCLRAQTAQAPKEEPWQMIGVWNLNIAQSPWLEGPPPQSHTVKYWWEGDRLKHFVRVVDEKGEHPGGWTVDRNFVSTTTPDTMYLKRVDAYTSELIRKNDGKVNVILTRIVWKDGKHATFVRQRLDENGLMTVYGVELYDKE